MANFVVQFSLRTEKYQEDTLNKRFEMSMLTGNKKSDKPIWKQINQMRKEYGLTEYLLHTDVKEMQKHFKKNIDSFTAQKIATTLWKSYDKLFYGNGKRIYYKKYGDMNSLEGKSNSTGIRFVDEHLIWNGLNIPVIIDWNNPYEYQAMQSEVSYCRIVRKFVRNKYKFYVQVVFKGTPPTKFNKETGEIKHSLGEGDVGLDIGTSTIAISSNTEVKLLILADKVQNIEDEKRRLLRKMDRSRRATNLENYNEDGTVRKQGSKKVFWNKSNHYVKYQNQLKELYRKQADVRKYQHECLANYIISLGNNVYVEQMNFAGLQKKATKTEKNDSGKFKRKKRFGKSLANRAPAMLMTIINRKLAYYGLELIEINTFKAKASQFNHMTGEYHKKSLSQRWNDLNGAKIQRDLYSSFLIMNISDDLESFDIEKCNDRFDNFKKLHDIEIQRLSNIATLSSMGV